MNTEIVHGVYAKLENRPGTLEQLSKIVQERRANIDAIGLETVGSTGFVRILVQRPREVVENLRRNGIEAFETDFVVASIPNRPGELLQASRELAAARINVESVISTPDGRLAFRTNDNETTARILGKL